MWLKCVEDCGVANCWAPWPARGRCRGARDVVTGPSRALDLTEAVRTALSVF